MFLVSYDGGGSLMMAFTGTGIASSRQPIRCY